MRVRAGLEENVQEKHLYPISVILNKSNSRPTKNLAKKTRFSNFKAERTEQNHSESMQIFFT